MVPLAQVGPSSAPVEEPFAVVRPASAIVGTPLAVRVSTLAPVVMRDHRPRVVAHCPAGPHGSRDEVGVLASHAACAGTEERIEPADLFEDLAAHGHVCAVHDPRADELPRRNLEGLRRILHAHTCIRGIVKYHAPPDDACLMPLEHVDDRA